MDRFTLNSQLEHLQSKHVGTGHADTTRYEWLVNQHRDTLAMLVGFHHMTSFNAIAENESIGRTRYNLIQKMVKPCHHDKKKPDGGGTTTNSA